MSSNQFFGGREAWHLTVSVDAGSRVGFGHLKRCIAIAKRARSEGARVDFRVAGDIASAGRVVELAGFDYRKAAAERMGRTVVLVDRVHSDVLRNPEALEIDIAHWRGRGDRIALIDGAGTDSLRHRRPQLPLDLVIVPYAGARSDDSSRLLAGPAFAPLDAEYANLDPPMVRPEADRILVSCGGSDPFKITARILKGLTEIQSRRLTVRVVLGPGFELAYRSNLITASHGCPHDIEWIDSPDSLASHVRWSDVTLATSGMTKYELAAAGTPAILISPDETHSRANESFLLIGSAIDLGLIESMTPPGIASTLCALLDDRPRRSEMSGAGMRAIDGRGAARIAAALKGLACAEI